MRTFYCAGYCAGLTQAHLRSVARWIARSVLLICAMEAYAVASPMPTMPKVRVSGARFVTDAGKPYVPFGVNYYRPGTGWAPQVWRQFDEDATRRDFARIRELGGNCVRVFLTFGSFYSQPEALDEDGVAKLDRFLDLADEAGLYVHPTGPDHWEGLPEWMKGDHFADETVVSALETFWTLLATRYKGRTTIFAYDLLNEPTVRWDTPHMLRKWNAWLGVQYGTPERAARAWHTDVQSLQWGNVPVPASEPKPDDQRLLDYQHFRESVADEWTRRQAQAIKEADPDALVTVGLIQWAVPMLLPTVAHYAAFRPSRQAPYLDFLEVHFYPLDSGAYQYRTPEERDRNLAYLDAVVREVARFGKPVIIAEFGWYGGGGFGNNAPASEKQQADWCESVVRTTAGPACGWLNWGFHDQPEAKDVSVLTGLLKADGTTKEWGRRFAALSEELTRSMIPKREAGQRPTLDWDPCLTDPAAGNAFRKAFYAAYAQESR